MSLVGKYHKHLIAQCKTWIAADTCKHDIWNIDVQTQAGGNFMFCTAPGQKGMNERLESQHNIRPIDGRLVFSRENSPIAAAARAAGGGSSGSTAQPPKKKEEEGGAIF